jgi:hypothetical protein
MDLATSKSLRATPYKEIDIEMEREKIKKM